MAATQSSQRKAESTNSAVPEDSDANTHEEGYLKWWSKTQGLSKVLIYWAPQLLQVLKNKQWQWRKVLHWKKRQSSPTTRLTTRPAHLLYKSKTTQKKVVVGYLGVKYTTRAGRAKR
eukprot:264115-Ditylum_brightwellii.AAC.1